MNIGLQILTLQQTQKGVEINEAIIINFEHMAKLQAEKIFEGMQALQGEIVVTVHKVRHEYVTMSFCLQIDFVRHCIKKCIKC